MCGGFDPLTNDRASSGDLTGLPSALTPGWVRLEYSSGDAERKTATARFSNRPVSVISERAFAVSLVCVISPYIAGLFFGTSCFSHLWRKARVTGKYGSKQLLCTGALATPIRPAICWASPPFAAPLSSGFFARIGPFQAMIPGWHFQVFGHIAVQLLNIAGMRGFHLLGEGMIALTFIKVTFDQRVFLAAVAA
jgi:hypothetical protein